MFFRRKICLLILMVVAGIIGAYFLDIEAFADENASTAQENSVLQVVEQTTLLPLAQPPFPAIHQRVRVIVTGYSSSIEETDDTPFITASGSSVRDGIVANNLLPFGALVRLPEVFGEKIFVVDDRMNENKGYYHFDIWFPSKEEAVNFGAKLTTMEILTN